MLGNSKIHTKVIYQRTLTTIPLEQICDFITAQSLYRPLLDFWVEIKKNC